jgi:23S rRNA pseudouridine1911/1915/1917 synthase
MKTGKPLRGQPRQKNKFQFPRAKPGAEFHVFTCRTPGQRLDSYLTKRFTGFSRSFLADLCRQGQVLVAGVKARPSRRLAPDEEIKVYLPEGAKANPEDIGVELIHEDAAVFVVNKPAGVVVHPARGHLSGTLYHGLLWLFREQLQNNPEFKIGSLHRLDMDTSGVMIYAKDERNQKRVARAIEGRNIKKTYLAIVHGEFPFDQVTIEGDVGSVPEEKRMAIDGQDARDARTGVSCLSRSDGFSFLKLDLHTGRSHQIRVHLSAAGFPIVGDVLYGGQQQAENGDVLIGRQALHAWRLQLEHPLTGESVTYQAELPPDMQALVNRYSLERA